MESDEPPLVLLGESGTGKSALIANWSEQYRKNHPEDFIVCHYIGSTSDSSDYVNILRRIIEEIKERYEPGIKGEGISYIHSTFGNQGDENKIPTDPKKIVEAFPEWLARAAAKSRFILILDALDQLEDRDNASDLSWVPYSFSTNIRLIVSTLPGRSLDALKRRNWPEMNIRPMEKDEKRKYITEYLLQYRKHLSPTQIERIVKKKHTTNPLYLRTLLEELRVFGVHEELDMWIKHYLKAKTIDTLYGLVLERLEADYERERKGLVRNVMTLIWASRKGLSETELLEIIGAYDKSIPINSWADVYQASLSDGMPMPRAYWSPLYLAIEDSLVNKAGLLNFFHEFLRKAVEKRYLSSIELKKVVHSRIANYFEKRGLDDRKVDELPWQLCREEFWEKLKDCVTNMEMFLELRTETKQYELTKYWLSMGGRYDMVREYQKMIEQYENTSPDMYEFSKRIVETAHFLQLNAKYEKAELLYRRAMKINWNEDGLEHPDAAVCLINLGELLINKGDYEGAEPVLRQAIAVNETVFGTEHSGTARAMNGLAVLLYKKGDYECAESFFRKVLTICEKVLGSENPFMATILNNLAELLNKRKNIEEAEPFYRRALAIDENILGLEHPITAMSLNNLAGLLREKGNYGEAEQLFRRALVICDKILPEHPNIATCLNNLGGLLFRKGDYKGAESHWQRALAVREIVLGEHPDTATSLNTLAETYRNRKNYREAEPLYRRALIMREKVLPPQHLDIAQSLNNLGLLLEQKGNHKEAELLYRRGYALYKEVLGTEHPWTVTVIGNLDNLSKKKNKLGWKFWN